MLLLKNNFKSQFECQLFELEDFLENEFTIKNKILKSCKRCATSYIAYRIFLSQARDEVVKYRTESYRTILKRIDEILNEMENI
jgi:hypothetical protein